MLSTTLFTVAIALLAPSNLINIHGVSAQNKVPLEFQTRQNTPFLVTQPNNGTYIYLRCDIDRVTADTDDAFGYVGFKQDTSVSQRRFAVCLPASQKSYLAYTFQVLTQSGGTFQLLGVKAGSLFDAINGVGRKLHYSIDYMDWEETANQNDFNMWMHPGGSLIFTSGGGEARKVTAQFANNYLRIALNGLGSAAYFTAETAPAP